MKRFNPILVQKNIAFLLLIIFFYSCNKEEPSPLPNPENEISISTKYLDLSKEMTSEEITLDAESNWQIINDTNTWVTVSPMEGNAGKGIILQVNATENETPNVRIAKILIKSVSSSTCDTLTIRQYGKTPYVPIAWDKDATLSRFDLKSGVVDITFNGDIPNFTPGVSSIVVPTDSLVYIRVVNEAQENGNQVSLKTTEGNMTNIFMNQEFTLSTVPLEKKLFLRSGNLSTTDSKGVIHPIRISTFDKEGRKTVLYDAENPALLRNMDIDKNLNFFYYRKDFSGKTLFKKGGVTLQWDKCVFESALDGQFHFSFSDTMQVLNESLVVPKGELLTFFYLLKGSVDFDLLLHMIAEGKFGGETSEPVEIVKDVLGVKGLHIDFMVGNVPVRIVVKVDILGEASITSQMRGDLTGGFHTGLTLSCDVSYYGKDNGFRAEKGVIPHFSLYKPEIKVKGKMDVNASIYPEISVMLYNFAGPTVKVIPTLGDEIQYGGHAGGESEIYASWTNRLYTNINATGQLNLNFVGETISSPELPLMDEYQKDLYRTPEQIEFTEKNVKTRVGKPITVKVKVTDYSALQEDPPLSTGAVVKFEPTEGKVKQEFALTGIDGTASVVYTPTSEESYLKAKIMNADGEEIDSDILYPKFGKAIDIVGIWYSPVNVANGGTDRLVFYPDGTYAYQYNEESYGGTAYYIYDGKCNGTYHLDDAIGHTVTGDTTGAIYVAGYIDLMPLSFKDNSRGGQKNPDGGYDPISISLKDEGVCPEFYSLYTVEGRYNISFSKDGNGEYNEVCIHGNIPTPTKSITLYRISENPEEVQAVARSKKENRQ